MIPSSFRNLNARCEHACKPNLLHELKKLSAASMCLRLQCNTAYKSYNKNWRNYILRQRVAFFNLHHKPWNDEGKCRVAFVSLYVMHNFICYKTATGTSSESASEKKNLFNSFVSLPTERKKVALAWQSHTNAVAMCNNIQIEFRITAATSSLEKRFVSGNNDSIWHRHTCFVVGTYFRNIPWSSESRSTLRRRLDKINNPMRRKWNRVEHDLHYFLLPFKCAHIESNHMFCAIFDAAHTNWNRID